MRPPLPALLPPPQPPQQIHEIGRRKALVERLLDGLNYRTHPQSPHFWIEVPELWRASQIAAELKENNYLVATAEASTDSAVVAVGTASANTSVP